MASRSESQALVALPKAEFKGFYWHEFSAKRLMSPDDISNSAKGEINAQVSYEVSNGKHGKQDGVSMIVEVVMEGTPIESGKSGKRKKAFQISCKAEGIFLYNAPNSSPEVPDDEAYVFASFTMPLVAYRIRQVVSELGFGETEFPYSVNAQDFIGKGKLLKKKS